LEHPIYGRLFTLGELHAMRKQTLQAFRDSAPADHDRHESTERDS
jgi:hypothetical protein